MSHINLNKEVVSKEGILTRINDIDVYRYYTGSEIEIKGGQKSPLRTDNNPSFGYFLKNNEILFNDFKLGGGDFVKFVMLKFGLTYFEALSKIVVDFNLTDWFFYKDIVKTNKDYNPDKFKTKEKLIATANKRKLNKSRRPWKSHDLLFWEAFGIDKKTLIKYNVEPIDYIFIDNLPIKADKYAYCFKEYKDGKETYKIYQPFNDKYKWLNSHNDSVWQGWTQLPKKGDTIIITKSLKDVMSIVSVLGIPSVALQSESVIPKDHVLDELIERFQFKALLYDNDFDKEVNFGEKAGYEIVKDKEIAQFHIPDRFKCKDFSDLVKKYGREKAKEIYKQNIEMPF